MKKFAGILLLIIGFGGCLMSREATQDTILKDELLVSESSLPDTDGVLPQADGASFEVAGKQERKKGRFTSGTAALLCFFHLTGYGAESVCGNALRLNQLCGGNGGIHYGYRGD